MSEAHATRSGHAANRRRLAPRADLQELSARFARSDRLQVAEVLDPDFCAALSRAIAEWREWALVTTVQGRHHNFDAEQMERIDPAKRADFDEMVATGARGGFQYLYERYPLHDPHIAPPPMRDPVLAQVRELMQDEAFLGLARTVTGREDIRHADCQMTRYRRGHFLTWHTDHADGKHRVAAYVLGLTPHWPADYGGQLQFVAGDGSVEAVFMPRFNTLNIFSVPAPHLVSAVAPFVTESRYSLTGWFRTQ
jgi:SM-20-related protein